MGLSLIACHQNKPIVKKNEVIGDSIKPVSKPIYVLDSLDYLVMSEAIYQYLIIPPSIGHRYYDFRPTTLKDRIKGIKSFVLLDQTRLDDSIDKYVIDAHKEIDSTDNNWIYNIAIRNLKTSQIDSSALRILHYRTATESSIKSLISLEYGYSKFMEYYGEPSILMSVSIPGFNDNKDRAMIFVSWSSSSKSGQGGLIWLKKKKGKWVSYDLVILWVA
jgi:hypothetical protein